MLASGVAALTVLFRAHGVLATDLGVTMRLPVDTSKLTIIVIGDPSPVLEFGTNSPKLTPDGRALHKIPVLLTGTGERVEPTATVTVAGTLPALSRGGTVEFTGLTASTWTIRDQNGRERSGMTLRAEGVRPESKPSSK
jgi:hypothetical protein